MRVPCAYAAYVYSPWACRWVPDPAVYTQVNDVGARSVARACVEARVPRLVHIRSRETPPTRPLPHRLVHIRSHVMPPTRPLPHKHQGYPWPELRPAAALQWPTATLRSAHSMRGVRLGHMLQSIPAASTTATVQCGRNVLGRHARWRDVIHAYVCMDTCVPMPLSVSPSISNSCVLFGNQIP